MWVIVFIVIVYHNPNSHSVCCRHWDSQQVAGAVDHIFSHLFSRLVAWLTQAVIAGIFGYALQTDCPMDFVEKNTLQLLTVSVIYALVLALLVHIWGRNAPLKDRSPGADG